MRVVNPETITATTAAHAAGAVGVLVINLDGTQAAVAGGFKYAATSAVRSDFTGDLKSDILWRHAAQGDVWLWPMDGPARTAETYVRTVSDPNWRSARSRTSTATGGRPLLAQHGERQLYYWPMDGATALDEVYAGTVDPAYDIVGSGDFNADGKADLLWRHTTLGDVWVWLMDGATPLSQVYVDTVDPGYVVRGVGDLDANGKADIVWHGATGEVWVWPMDGTTRLDQVWVGSVPDTEYQIEGVADVTGDRKADLVWWHATRGRSLALDDERAGAPAEDWVATVADTAYHIAGTGDYNGDGKADLLWHHAVNGEVWVWLMNGPCACPKPGSPQCRMRGIGSSADACPGFGTRDSGCVRGRPSPELRALVSGLIQDSVRRRHLPLTALRSAAHLERVVHAIPRRIAPQEDTMLSDARRFPLAVMLLAALGASSLASAQSARMASIPVRTATCTPLPGRPTGRSWSAATSRCWAAAAPARPGATTSGG